MKILLVEDDSVIASNIALILERGGYLVDHSTTITKALQEIMGNDYDCIVLDRGLPDGDGLSLILEMREQKITTPVLILTAYTTMKEKVTGLDTGADDYLLKPFHPSELLARIRVLIRRGVRQPKTPIINIKELRVNTNTREVSVKGKIIDLSPREYALLEYMAYHPCQVIDRVILLSHAWDQNIDLLSNTVDVHIRYIRKKLGKNASKFVKTVRGKGYMICAN